MIGEQIMNGKFPLFGRDQIENSFMHLVDRSICEQRWASGDLPSSRYKASIPGKKVVHCRHT
jgi:hypothetical protein